MKKRTTPKTETTVAEIARLASEGMVASEIANTLGFSRAYIYHLANQYSLSLPSAHVRHIPKQTQPVPRVVTGGVTVPVNHIVAGTISELLVAADLLARGWQPYSPIVRHRGHDLIAVRGESVITVEVRSAKENTLGKIVFGKTHTDKSDVYALVVTGKPVTYEPADAFD